MSTFKHFLAEQSEHELRLRHSLDVMVQNESNGFDLVKVGRHYRSRAVGSVGSILGMLEQHGILVHQYLTSHDQYIASTKMAELIVFPFDYVIAPDLPLRINVMGGPVLYSCRVMRSLEFPATASFEHVLYNTDGPPVINIHNI